MVEGCEVADSGCHLEGAVGLLGAGAGIGGQLNLRCELRHPSLGLEIGQSLADRWNRRPSDDREQLREKEESTKWLERSRG